MGYGVWRKGNELKEAHACYAFVLFLAISTPAVPFLTFSISSLCLACTAAGGGANLTT